MAPKHHDAQPPDAQEIKKDKFVLQLCDRRLYFREGIPSRLVAEIFPQTSDLPAHHGLHGLRTTEHRGREGRMLRGVEPRDLDFVRPGMLIRAMTELDKRGYINGEIMDSRTCHPFTTHLPVDRERGLELYDAGFLQLITSSKGSRGTLLCPTISERVDLIVLLARFYPRARIGIVCRSTQTAWEWRDQLDTRLRDSVKVLTRGCQPGSERIQVCTRGSFAVDRLDIVIFDDATFALVGNLPDHLDLATGQNIYGFTNGRERLTIDQSMHLEGFLGPEIYNSLPLSQQKPLHHVVILKTPDLLKSVTGSILEVKRQSIWHNDARNDLVAKTATALVTNDRKSLAALGLSQGITTIMTSMDRPEVAIQVESIQHAKELLQRLPDWRLLSKSAEPIEQFHKPSESGRKTKIANSGSIITGMMMEEIHQLAVDCIIRADGGLGDWTARCLNTASDRPGLGRKLLIDFDDTGLGGGDTTQRRIEFYRARNWKITRSTQGNFVS